MNKNLHKVIFNKSTGLIIAVCETAHNNGKSSKDKCFQVALFNLSGSLKRSSTSVSEVKNNFDKDKVQSEIDLQVKVTKEFRSNVQHFQAEQNKRKDELKAKLENNEISQADYDEQISRIQKQSLLVNMIAGGLMSPSDSVLGIATSTVSPAVSYEIGQYFKKEGKEGSFEHIATHAVLGALTSAANGGNALSGAVSAGGAEYIAKVTAETLFQKDAKDLTADEKQTVSSIAQLVGVISGSVTGDSSVNAYIGNTVATNAVDNNLLSPDEWKELSRLDELARKNGTLTKAQAERAKFLLNKHGYTERLLAKEQNGETLSKGEKSDLDNAIYEAYSDPEEANRIRNYKGPVAQGDYRDLKAVVNREIGYSESFLGRQAESMQYPIAAGMLYEFGFPITQSMATTMALKKHSGQEFTPDDAADSILWAVPVGVAGKKTVKVMDNWAKIDHTGKATGKGLGLWKKFYIDQSINTVGTGATLALPQPEKNNFNNNNRNGR